MPKAIEQKQKALPCLNSEDDFIIEGNLNNRYYKMLEKLYDDMKCVKTHITFYRGQARNMRLSNELNALHKSAEDSVAMALCSLNTAQYALHNAIRIRAEFEFVK